MLNDMNAKKPSFYTKYIKSKITVSLLIFIIGGGITYYINDKIKNANIEQRIYPTPERLIRAMDHDDEVPTDVENFKREVRLIEQGDIQIEQQIKIDSQQLHIQRNIKVIDSFYQFAKKKAISDSIKEIVKQKSRDKRTEEIINIGNAIRAIQAEKKNQ